MRYRPEHQLDRLRMMVRTVDPDIKEANRHACGSADLHPHALLHLRWLRTLVIDLSHAPPEQHQATFELLQRRKDCLIAAERVICKGLSENDSCLLPLLTRFVPLLTSLDLRGCGGSVVDDAFLIAVADAHSSSLQRLYLPWNSPSNVTQSTLDRFTKLEELDASVCARLHNVDFCSATLRVLYANHCEKLTDEGLRNATRLEVLHVCGVDRVTDVSPFEHRLLELNGSWNCGIGSNALSRCHRLQALDASYNPKIAAWQMCTQQLRELKAAGNPSLNDAALVDATGLVRLKATGNLSITTVEPFAVTLRVLHAEFCGINDSGLRSAANIVSLNAEWNTHIHSLLPFSSSLLELHVSRVMENSMLAAAPNLIRLSLENNENITIVQSCGHSLRHLLAFGRRCGLTIEGVRTATHLVTLDCAKNPHFTTIEPFQESLQELVTDCHAQCLEVKNAPNLHRIYCFGNTPIKFLEQNGFWRAVTDSNSLLFRQAYPLHVSL